MRACALAASGLVLLLGCQQSQRAPSAEPSAATLGELPELPPVRLTQPSEAQRALAEQDSSAATTELADSGPMSGLRRDAMLQLARRAESEGHTAEAHRRYLILRQSAPPHADVELGLGRLHWQRGELEYALDAWARACRIDADRVDAHQVLEAALRGLDRSEDADNARLAYERAVQRLAFVLESETDPLRRGDAVARLRRSSPDPKAARALIRALDDDAFRVRVDALEALVDVATPDVLSILEPHRDADTSGRFDALYTRVFAAAESRRATPTPE